MATIRVTYILSDAGQRANLKAGGDGLREQVIEATQENSGDAWPALVDLAEARSTSGNSWALHISRPVYDTPQTLADLVRNEQARRRGEQEQKEAEQRERAQKLLEGGPEAILREGTLYVRQTFGHLPEFQSLLEQAAKLQEERQQEAERKRREAEEERKRQDEQQRQERAEWIKAHGSNRLKRLLEEKIECEAVYLDERLAVERPGWVWYNDLPGHTKDPRNPPESAFVVLDEARKVDPDAYLQFYAEEHEHTEDCGYDEDCPKYERKDYVAEANFLGLVIVLFPKRD